MSVNREEVLADFQACTGIDDVAEAILHLEETNWDLLGAINRVMPQDTQTLPSEVDTDVQMVEEVKRPRSVSTRVTRASSSRLSSGANNSHRFRMPTSISADVISLPSTSHGREARSLNFHVYFREKDAKLTLPDTDTVGELKNTIFVRLGVPVCQQNLQGWKNSPKSDSVTLSSLNLPKENTLYVIVPDLEDGCTAAEESKFVERLIQTYTLNIRDEASNKTYKLKFLGSKTILEVKTDVYTLTDIPVRHQVWKGWPPNVVNDKTTLASSGINYPSHDFVLERAASTANNEKRIVVDLVESDNSSAEEFEDASETFAVEDDIFVDVETKRMQPLIPDNVEDETAACIHFCDQFTSRYGSSHPDFFPGSLEDAIKEACMKPAKDRRLLAIYLHHDASVLTNVFCTQLLGYESVLQCLSNHFVVWGWDLTHESNKQKFLSSVSKALGSVAAMTIRSIDVDTLPVLIIIMRMRSTTDIYTVVHGNIGVNELLTSLVQAVEVFTEQQRIDMKEEEDRAARERVKMEQDAAYQESLAADRAKEEAKRRQELMESKEKERKQILRQEIELIREAYRLEIESQLPDEPEEGSGEDIAKIRFRLPKGETAVRRFRAQAPLKVLLDYLVVLGYPPDEYKVLSSWPRRDLTALDPKNTLQELKLYPQETVILEER